MSNYNTNEPTLASLTADLRAGHVMHIASFISWKGLSNFVGLLRTDTLVTLTIDITGMSCCTRQK